MNLMFLLEAQNVSTSERLTEGVTALISGMGAVFLILVLISTIISLFKFLKAGEITHEHKEARINAVVETQLEEEPEEDPMELIAVITAAVAASLGTTTDRLQVRSFRRIGSKNR